MAENRKRKEILVIENLSITRPTDKRNNVIHAIEKLDLSVKANEIVAVVGISGSGKSSIAQAVAGLIPFVAKKLSVDKFDVIELVNSILNKNAAKIRRPHNVNFISKERIHSLSEVKITPFNFLHALILDTDVSVMERKKNRLELDIEYMDKILLLNDLYKHPDIQADYLTLREINERFETLFSDNAPIKMNNHLHHTHDEVRVVEKNYIYTIEEIREKIRIHRSNLDLYRREYTEKVDIKYAEKLGLAKLALEMLEDDYNKKLNVLKKEFHRTKKEVAEDFADLHRSHLQERKDFVTKSYNDEKATYDLEFKKRRTEILDRTEQISKDYKLELAKTKKTLKTKYKELFDNEINRLNKELKITIKEFENERKRVINRLKRKFRKATKTENNKAALLNEVENISTLFKQVKVKLIDTIDHVTKSLPDYLEWRMKVDQLVLEWKQLRMLPAFSKRITKKRARHLAVLILNKVGMHPRDMHTPINKLLLINKIRLMLARSFTSNYKLTVIDNIFTMITPLRRKLLFLQLKEIAKVHQNSILFFSEDLNYIWELSDRAFILKNGKIIEHGSSDEIYGNPIHPFTKMAVSSIASLDDAMRGKTFIPYISHHHIEDNVIPHMHQILGKDHYVFGNDKEVLSWQNLPIPEQESHDPK